jgi:hypothetical protein
LADQIGESRGTASSRGPGPGAPDLHALAVAWIDAWNERDVEALVALADQSIELHPLRLRSLGEGYEGHDGLREWMAAIEDAGHEHRITLEGFHELKGDRIVLEGQVTIGGRFTSPYSGIYEFEAGRVKVMSHYFTPLSLLESIGVLDPGDLES